MKFVLVTESSTMRNPAPKLIWAMLVFLSSGHTKTKENQIKSEMLELISKLQNLVKDFKLSKLLLYMVLKGTLLEN